MSKALRFLKITAKPSRFSFSYRISNGKTSSCTISIKLLQILLKLCKHREDRLGEKSSCEHFVRLPVPRTFNFAEVK